MTSAIESCWQVYILKCGDGSLYTGITTNIEQRLSAHNAGTGAKSTRGRTWVLLYAERHNTRGEAMSREWHLKRDRRFRKAVLPTHISS